MPLSVSDGLLILATMLGPILAVQAQKWIERSRESRGQRLSVFAALMTTRATRLSNEHVQALNHIDLVFRKRPWPFNRGKDRAVREAWRLYADKLNEKAAESEAELAIWLSQSYELFIGLLEAMARALGYTEIDKVLLKRGIYRPRAHGDEQELLRNIQEGLAAMLSGNNPIAMRVVEFPANEDMQKSMQDVLTGESALRVKIEEK